MQKSVFCPTCGLTVGEQIGGKLFLGLAGLLVTGKMNPWLALAATVAGIWFGHTYIDSTVRTCPHCGTIIRVAEGLL